MADDRLDAIKARLSQPDCHPDASTPLIWGSGIVRWLIAQLEDARADADQQAAALEHHRLEWRPKRKPREGHEADCDCPSCVMLPAQMGWMPVRSVADALAAHEAAVQRRAQ